MGGGRETKKGNQNKENGRNLSGNELLRGKRKGKTIGGGFESFSRAEVSLKNKIRINSKNFATPRSIGEREK